jgi:hypothetical protein
VTIGVVAVPEAVELVAEVPFCSELETANTALEGLEGALLPMLFVAVTVKVYSVPGVKPPTFALD